MVVIDGQPGSTEEQPERGEQDDGEVGKATTGKPNEMTENEPKGMTWYEKTVIEQMQGQP